MTDIPSVFDMTTNEFERAVGELDIFGDPLPLEYLEDPLQSEGQPWKPLPNVANEVTATEGVPSNGASSLVSKPLEEEMNYPSPTQAWNVFGPYLAKSQEERFPSDIGSSYDNSMTDELVSPRHVPHTYADNLVNKAQNDTKQSASGLSLQYPNQFQHSGIPASSMNPTPQQHGLTQSIVQPGSPKKFPISKNLGLADLPVSSQQHSNIDLRKALSSGEMNGYIPEAHYQNLPQTPASWDVFKYNEYGELTPGRVYTASELRRYLFEHPLHQTPNGYRPKDGGLTLWIQQNPFDSFHRCSNLEATRCRFLKCSGNKNTIGIGATRVAFDEHTKDRYNHNPQHNAGYVHLFCLERFMDFPEICLKLDIRAENRILPLEPFGKNLMALESMQEYFHAQKFIDACQKDGPSPGYPHYLTSGRPYEGTLLHKMTSEKEAARWKLQQKQPQEKGQSAADFTKYHGNLERETQMRTKTRSYNSKKSKKPSLLIVEEESSEGNEEIIEDKKDHSQIRRLALQVVREEKKRSSGETNAKVKANNEWAHKYLQANPIRQKDRKAKTTSEPLAKPSGRPRKTAVGPSSKITGSQTKGSQQKGKDGTRKSKQAIFPPGEESDKEPRAKKRKLVQRWVYASEQSDDSEEEVLPKSLKRGRPSHGESAEENEESEESENVQPRRSKRLRRPNSFKEGW